jgi:hypothetical protein
VDIKLFPTRADLERDDRRLEDTSYILELDFEFSDCRILTDLGSYSDIFMAAIVVNERHSILNTCTRKERNKP